MSHSRGAYAAAGVDVAAGDRAVELLRARLRRSTDLLGVSGFGAAVELPAGYLRPVLVSATDGVGTKTDIARRLGRHAELGQDLVAMCADDVVCHAARPLFFLDYIAVGRVVPERVAEVVGGVARACEAIGCALVGGETAEHPGLMEADELDLAGFCVGVVERDALIDGSRARPGDAVIGLASSGLHANGFSLIRSLLDAGSLALDDDLITPTRLYTPAVLRLIDDMNAAGKDVAGLAHVTGGGMPANLPRAVPETLGVEVDASAWPQPPIFGRIARAAGIGQVELRATFNAGIGMAAVVPADAVDAALTSIAELGIEAWHIGRVFERDAGEARYRESA